MREQEGVMEVRRETIVEISKDWKIQETTGSKKMMDRALVEI